MNITANEILDAKGLACPMPIIKAKKALQQLDPGKVLEIQATDQGSTADLKAWSESAGHQYIGTIEVGAELKHYIRKSNDDLIEKKHPHVVNNDELRTIIEENDQGIAKKVILDVRESAEYAFQHIPGSVNIPLGELEKRKSELSQEDSIYVVCRTGSRSDLAAQALTQYGFKEVVNVVPGMKEWGVK